MRSTNARAILVKTEEFVKTKLEAFSVFVWTGFMVKLVKLGLKVGTELYCLFLEFQILCTLSVLS